MIQTPPQIGKSTLSSRLFPACALAHNPRLNLLLISYAGTLAGEHSLAARDHVAEHGRTLRPDGALDLNTGARARDFWQVRAGGTLKSAGIYGSLTGRPADIAIVDDPFAGYEDSISVTQRDKVEATYRSVIETRLQENGLVVSIGTPWHVDDLRGRLLAAEADRWLVLRYPAIAEENDVLGREPGDPLCPERRSMEFWEDVRNGFERSGRSHLWKSLYQCDPTADAATCAFHDQSWFAEHLWVDCLPDTATNKVVHRVLALDPCKSKHGKVGDYASFADLTLLSDGVVYAQMYLSRPTLPALYAQAHTLVKAAIDENRPYTAMICETNLFQQAVAVAIQERLDRERIALQVVEHNTASTDEKFARIVHGLSPMLRTKRLKFIGKTDSNLRTVAQTKEIPNGAHDDGPDSIELGFKLLNKLLPSRTQQGIRIT